MWIPPQVGLLVYSFGIPAVMFLPDSPPVVESGEGSDALLEPTQAQEMLPPWKTSLVAQFRAVTIDYWKSFDIVIDLFVHHKLSRLCLAIFFFNVTAMGVRIIFQQWASMFFHWTLVETSYVLSFELLVNGLVLVFLPSISKKLLKPWLGSIRRAEIWVVKASLLMNIVGVLCMSFASTGAFFAVSLTLYSAGGGLYDALKSFATGYLQKEQITRFYVGISMVESIGGLIGGPLWTGIFSLSLSVDFLAVGWSFWLCSLCFLCAFTTVIKLEKYLKTLTLSRSISW